MILNVKSAIPLETLITTEDSAALDFSKIEWTINHNYTVEKTIMECKESINKLRLIQSAVKSVNNATLVHFLQHCNSYTWEELEKILGALDRSGQPSLQEGGLFEYT